MSSKPWYAWFPADFRAKTAHLTYIESEAYRRLLDAYYERRCALPAGKTALYRLCSARGSVEEAAIDTVSAEFFTEVCGFIRHQRCDEQILKETRLNEAWVEAGRKGGLSSAQGRLKAGSTIPDPNPQPDSDSKKTNPLFAKANGAWDDFWKLYPRKTAKKKAQERWKTVKATEVVTIMAALRCQLESDQWRRMIIPHPATWLNQRRWEDEPLALANALGECTWNINDNREPGHGKCSKPATMERNGARYCDYHGSRI